MKTIRNWLVVLLLLAAAGFWLWRMAHRLPDLTAPVTALDSAFLSDGGSVSVTLGGADGKRALVVLQADPRTPRDRAPVRLARWPALPWTVPLPVGSHDEGCVAARLASWRSSMAKDQVHRAGVDAVITAIAARQPGYARLDC